MRRSITTMVIALTLAAAACSSNGGGSSSSSAAATSAAASASAGGSGTTITAQGFAFHPDAVSVGAGKVTLTVTNDDATEHTFTLDDGSSSTPLQPGTTQTITLDLSKTVGWHCSILTSMTGTLNVG